MHEKKKIRIRLTVFSKKFFGCHLIKELKVLSFFNLVMIGILKMLSLFHPDLLSFCSEDVMTSTSYSPLVRYLENFDHLLAPILEEGWK